VGHLASIEELTQTAFDRMVSTNIVGTYSFVRSAIAHLDEGSRIINIGSINAERVQTSGLAVYAMTKGAIASLAKGLARELGPRGITVNNVQPGPVDTDANPAVGAHADALRAMVALGRYGTPAMWPQSSAFWPVANPATSPARTGTSTAASCSDSPSASRDHQIRSQLAVDSGVRVPTGIGHDQHE